MTTTTYRFRTPAKVIAGVVCLVIARIAAALGAEPDSDAEPALSTIFGDTIRHDSALPLHLRASRLPLETRFDFLSAWVLPSDRHRSLRVDAGFMPVDPIAAAGPDELARSGGVVVSSAIDLVDTAARLNRLESLHKALEGFEPQDVEQKKTLCAFRMTLAVADEDFDAALTNLEELIVLANASVPDRGPETVAFSIAQQHPETLEAAYALADVCYSLAKERPDRDGTAWFKHAAALKFRFEADNFSVPATNNDVDREPRLKHWQPVSRTTAATRGSGFPLPAWQSVAGRVRHMTAHDQDYLYYNIPLAGEYSVEADVTSFPHRDIHLALGGRWCGATSDKDFKWLACRTGTFRRETMQLQFDEPLSIIGDWMRVRIDVEHARRQTWVNGRLVREESHSADSDPWLAMHSSSSGGGIVRNVCITGSPEIPDVIRLAAEPDLPGWMPYYCETVGSNGDWSWEPGEDSSGRLALLRGLRHSRNGCAFESLLRYHRPMLEDGVIEYDFFYSDSQDAPVAVHPALDRLCFVLAPAGVKIHWATDGKFDRIGSDPAQAIDATVGTSDVITSAPRVPLRADDWNHLRLQLVGDIVHLTLNGQPIVSRKLEAGNRRTFGLFHYADRSEARVRNIRWRGEWPKQVPRLQEQELADQQTLAEIAEAIDLPVVMDHNFADGLPQGTFRIFSARRTSNISEGPDGVHVTREDDAGRYQLAAFGPQMRIGGDFEVTARFDALEFSGEPGGPCNIQLLVNIADANNSEYRIVRRDWNIIENNVGLQRTVLPRIIRTLDGRNPRTNLRSIGEEATSGRLRFLRRGDRLYFLFAEHDSPIFRLLNTQTVSKQPTTIRGIRLLAEATRTSGAMRVVWKQLTVRAEKLVEQ